MQSHASPGKCAATRRDGRPCQAPARPGAAWCIHHDPALAAQRDGWRRAGAEGKRTVNRVARQLPAGIRDVQDRLLATLAKVEAGEMEPRVAHAIAAVSRAYLQTWQDVELERRLAELERAAGLTEGASHDPAH